jgi:hypothetical protein
VAVTGRADIVTRLRDWASTICMVRGDDAPGSKARLALEAAELIEALRKANSEVFATGIKSVRDTAELAIELREARRERDEARREVARLLDVETGHRIAIASLTAERDEARRDACELWADAQFDGTDAVPSEYAKRRGWDCFTPLGERVRDSYKNGGAP